jgi:hypothetical protein
VKATNKHTWARSQFPVLTTVGASNDQRAWLRPPYGSNHIGAVDKYRARNCGICITENRNTKEKNNSMNNSTKTLVLAATVAGLLSGTTSRLQAQASQSNAKTNVFQVSKAGVRAVSLNADQDTDKHSCKGKNDCKGKGGCKSGDNGCAR